MASQANIVLIMTDQQRGDCLSIAGHPHVQTPHMDALGAGGARFTRAFAECPICVAARHTLLTGMEPAKTGVFHNPQRARIKDPDTTLPNLLRLSGYQTAMLGRGMHQYPEWKRYGFEIVEDSPYNDRYSRFRSEVQLLSTAGGFDNWPHWHGHGLGGNDWTSRPWHLDEEFHHTNLTVNRAIQFLDTHDREAPFFLSVGFVAPHPPLLPPQCYYDRYYNMSLDEPVIGDWAEPMEHDGLGYPPSYGKQMLSGPRLQQAKAGYYGAINHVDDQLNLLLQRLRHESGPTYVIFMSDHGEMLGDHYFWRKSLPYEGAANVPFLLNGPDIPQRTVIDRPIGLQDVLPTCCELADVAVPAHVTGRSVLSLIRGESQWRDVIFGEHAPMGDQHPGMHYVTDGRWKYVWFNDGCEQLFDTAEDPRELHDLVQAGESKDTLQELHGRLIKHLAGRPEGFSDGQQLIPGRDYNSVLPTTLVDPE
jgi:arylsulfatase A-like enzyme